MSDPSPSPHPARTSRATALERVATETVRLHKQMWGRGPESAKAHLLGDLLLVVMHGGETTAERTLLDAGNEDGVRATRQQFQNETTPQFVGMVERVLGRRVRTYQSQILFDPVIVVEIFALAAEDGDGPDDGDLGPGA